MAGEYKIWHVQVTTSHTAMYTLHDQEPRLPKLLHVFSEMYFLQKSTIGKQLLL